MSGADELRADPCVRSFRDPSGRVFAADNRIFRAVTDPVIAAAVPEILSLAPIRSGVERGAVVSSRVVEAAEMPPAGSLPSFEVPVPLFLEHERVPFASYPYEWPPEMLWQAGAESLFLARELLAHGHGLKDATPYNVLFRGPRAVFVDVLSVERRHPHDPIWTAAAQFSRTFLIPLLLSRRRSLPFRPLLLVHRDGMEPELAYALLGPLGRLLPPALGLVCLPALLGRAARRREARLYRPRRMASAEQAQFVLARTLAALRRKLERVRPPRRESDWSDYLVRDCSYAPAQLARKEAFVREALAEHHPEWVLDVGCNTGHFSALAAASGASVVAIDSDEVAVGQAWRRAVAGDLAMLTLVVDLARPSPAVGWRNAECSSFLDRAAGRFDGVLMLAVVHHLLVGERIPLREIAAMAAFLCRKVLVIEYVGKDDVMFRRIARGRESLFQDLDRTAFENALLPYFSVARVEHLPDSDRSLYTWTRRE
jgi:SAM-dependent methyltransferase